MKNGQDLRHLFKGTNILKAGFETGVHALPPEVKEEIEFPELTLQQTQQLLATLI